MSALQINSSQPSELISKFTHSSTLRDKQSNYSCGACSLDLLSVFPSSSSCLNVFSSDTAGQERFRAITRSYYRGAHGILIVYDVTDAVSFCHVRSWLSELARFHSPSSISSDVLSPVSHIVSSSFVSNDPTMPSLILVGNKADCPAALRQVTFQQGQALASSLGIPFLETSAKTSANVERAFFDLAAQMKVRLVKNHQLLADKINQQKKRSQVVNMDAPASSDDLWLRWLCPGLTCLFSGFSGRR